jgi:predicted DCC family thiol-disulfide oxidoreductase YuxK
MISVFYDGKCGLCRREIEHYTRIAPNGVFEWVDITVDASAMQKIGICYADGLKRLHAQDAHGTLHVGVDAFLVIWQQMPRWRLLATIVSFPIIRPVANIAYRAFAEWRFKRLSHCQIALQSEERNQHE